MMRIKSRIEKLERKLGPQEKARVFDPLNPEDLQEILHIPKKEVIRVKLSLLARVREFLGGQVDWSRIPDEEVTAGEVQKMIAIVGSALGLLPEGGNLFA